MSDTRGNQDVDGEFDAGRRDFLRKASYTAPVLVVLGIAAHSREAGAQFPPPPSAPNPTGSNAKEPSEEDLLLQELENKD